MPIEPVTAERFSEVLLDAFEGAAIAVVLTVDHGDHVERVYVNPAAARLSGYDRDELLRSDAALILPPEDRAELDRIRAAVLAGGPRPSTWETALVRKDGRRVPIHVCLAGAQFAGKPCNVAFIQDLTEAHAVRDALAASEKRFRDLAEHAPDTIVVIGQGRLLYANPMAVRTLGFDSPEEMLARPLGELVVADEAPVMAERIGRILRGERLPPMEYQGRRKDGGICVIEISTVATQYAGRPAVVGFGRDVTERKALIQRALHQDRLASVGSLAAGAAHEINNPLTYVILNLELLRLQVEGSPRSGVSLPLVEEALVGAQRVARIVQDLLALARPSEEVWETVRVADVAAAAVRLASTTQPSATRVECALDDLPAVRTNAARLGQVLLNVVVNALQALAGQPNARVTLTGRVAGDRVELVLADNGPGIPAAVLPRVFDPFFTTKPPGQGTGLGLTVTHSLVTSLGGTIHLASEEGAGTRVTIELPLGAAVPEGPAAARKASRVLLVDDEPGVTRVLEALLKDAHETVTHNVATQALAAFEHDRAWDAVLCDIRMPHLSGVELYLRVAERYPAVARRFVFTTGGALAAREAQVVAASGCPLLAKPFSRDDLLAAVANVITANAGGR